jgi:hypothetical protein
MVRSFSYMEKFVERLEKMVYRDGETMFGAPYDFRYAVAPAGRPSRVGSVFFRALKSLVERTYRERVDALDSLQAICRGGAELVAEDAEMGFGEGYPAHKERRRSNRDRQILRFPPIITRETVSC